MVKFLHASGSSLTTFQDEIASEYGKDAMNKKMRRQGFQVSILRIELAVPKRLCLTTKKLTQGIFGKAIALLIGNTSTALK